MYFKSLFIIFTFCFVSVSSAQIANDNVLFTIDKEPVYDSEFIRVYNKNLELVKDESQKDVDAYLGLFVNYKLKLKEAKSLGLDKKPNYLTEFESYKKQLAKNYLTNNKVTDALVEEAYEHMKYQVNANHVLVRVDENAKPSDTLLAYNEIIKLRERVINEGYKTVQKQVHNGKTIFAEDLGYFSAFKMVYPFEKAAFETNVGDISQPFRTRFGYHVVSILDKRKSRGALTVGHIMIANKSEASKESPEVRINNIYKRIQQGEEFEGLAKQFSEDKSSAKAGGKLKSFSGGELSSAKFEAAAFGLEKENDISKPFQSDFGWHVVKLYKKEGLKPFDELKVELENKVKRDSRSQIINNSRVRELKSRYKIVENQGVLPYFKSIVDDKYIKGVWQLPESFETQKEKVLFKINDKTIKYNNFGQFLVKSQRRNTTNKTLEGAVEEHYRSLIERELMKYQEDNLINENKDYANIVGEYRDGLLLFDLMETEIWSSAKKDSLALKSFYDSNLNKYKYRERIEADVASSAKKKNIKKVAKLLAKGESIEAINKSMNINDAVNVTFTSGVMNVSHQALPSGLKFKKGVSKVLKHNNTYVVVNTKNILPVSQKAFEEAKGSVTSDFQERKEKQWLSDLAKKYPVVLNKDVINKVKKKIKK